MPLPYHVPLPRSASIELIRTALTRRRVSQKELAERTGIPRDQLARILAGKVPFPHNPRTLSKLAEALGLDPSEFSEFRERLNVLPEPTRRLLAHLESSGIALEVFRARVTRLNDEALRLILSGGAPFPTDPRVIEDLAHAAQVEPFLFPDYLPLERLGDRLKAAAALALEPREREVFDGLLERISARLARFPEVEFDEALVARMAGAADLSDAVGTLRAFLPRWEDLQPEVRALVTGLEASGLTPSELARRAEVDRDELLAYLKGQLRLKDPALMSRLMAALKVG